MQDKRHASDLKELQVHVKANLLTRAGHIFRKFRKSSSEFEELVN